MINKKPSQTIENELATALQDYREWLLETAQELRIDFQKWRNEELRLSRIAKSQGENRGYLAHTFYCTIKADKNGKGALDLYWAKVHKKGEMEERSVQRIRKKEGYNYELEKWSLPELAYGIPANRPYWRTKIYQTEIAAAAIRNAWIVNEIQIKELKKIRERNEDILSAFNPE